MKSVVVPSAMAGPWQCSAKRGACKNSQRIRLYHTGRSAKAELGFGQRRTEWNYHFVYVYPFGSLYFKYSFLLLKHSVGLYDATRNY